MVTHGRQPEIPKGNQRSRKLGGDVPRKLQMLIRICRLQSDVVALRLMRSIHTKGLAIWSTIGDGDDVDDDDGYDMSYARSTYGPMGPRPRAPRLGGPRTWKMLPRITQNKT